MIDQFQAWDLSLLHLINQVWTAPALDQFFSVITDLHKQDWVRFGFLPLMILYAIYRHGRRAAKAALIMALTIGCCDFFNHRIVKQLFDRSRPFVTHPESVILRLPYRPGGNSFPSNHALNSAAEAGLISAYVPALAPYLITYSVLVAYSRPYLGVHYPSDVFAGWILGWLIASLVVFLLRRYLPDWGPRK